MANERFPSTKWQMRIELALTPPFPIIQIFSVTQLPHKPAVTRNHVKNHETVRGSGEIIYFIVD